MTSLFAGLSAASDVAVEKSEILVLEAVTATGGNDGNKRILNFMVLKLLFRRTVAVSVKIFSKPAFHFQIFGLMDFEELKAPDLAETILHFVTRKLHQGGIASVSVGELKVMSLSAKHLGISDRGFKFNISALEAVLTDLTRQENLGLSLAKNPRNHSLVLSKVGKKEGSEIFHATGCVQLMGWRSDPHAALVQLRSLVELHPEILLPAGIDDMKANRKRRDRDAQAAKRSRTGLLETSRRASIMYSEVAHNDSRTLFGVEFDVASGIIDSLLLSYPSPSHSPFLLPSSAF